jgi:DNA-binding NarL/FixJ family response regulator
VTRDDRIFGREHELATPQELQIAQMAGEGLSNREIGQKLYPLAPHGRLHLYRVYPKLGITSRAELRDALVATTASAVA